MKQAPDHDARHGHELVKRSTQRRVPAGIAAVLLMAALLSAIPSLAQAPAPKQATAPTTPVPEKAVPQGPVAIPVPEIAARATEVTNLLHALSTRLVPTEEIELISESLLESDRQIKEGLAETRAILLGQPDLDTLQNQHQQWQENQLRLTGWLKLLTDRAVEFSGEIDHLNSMKETWTKTREAAVAAKAPVPILQQIDGVLEAIGVAQAPLEAHRASLLDLQSRVARQVSECNTVLAEIGQAQGSAVGGIVRRDAVPIWDLDRWAQVRMALPARIDKTTQAIKTSLHRYIHDTSRGLPLHAGIFLLLAILLRLARGHMRRSTTRIRWSASAMDALDRPYSAALLGALIFASGPYSAAPPTLRGLFELLTFAPIIRIVTPSIDRRLMPEIYALWVLFATDLVRQGVTGGWVSGQVLLVLEALAGMCVLTWSLARRHIDYAVRQENGSFRIGLLRAAALLVWLTLAAGFLAGLIGYLSLSRLLTSEIIAGGTLMLALVASVRVLSGIGSFLLRVWPLRCLNMVDRHHDLLEHRLRRLLVLLATLTLAARLLDYLGLLAPALFLIRTILATKFERGSISISVTDIIIFLLTVWSAFLLSSFIRFVLKEDIYPRIGVPAGESYAASSLINYIILALGFVVGLGIVGVDLNRVTVLAGAFGVGIGFGLQNVVNNFVSGLILLFERPIHVGDVVEVGDLLGEVRRIGIRASRVRTWRGADIIVPNADLTGKQVTNWTLGDRLRRIDLQAGVNYGADPDEVIRILEAVANAHPDILKDPKPVGLFKGYGDSTIDFELRAWTDRFNNYPEIRSDLGVGIYRAILGAGMSFPFPQRDVHLVRDDGPPSAQAGEARDRVPPPEKP